MPCSWRRKIDLISIIRKLKFETSSQKIDVSADIILGFLTLLGFFILDLKWGDYLNICTSNSGMLCVHTFMCAYIQNLKSTMYLNKT